MHIDDDERFQRWHFVNFNPETPKHLAGKLINNRDGIRLAKLLWMYSNMFYYAKPWHQYLIQTDNNFGNSNVYNSMNSDGLSFAS